MFRLLLVLALIQPLPPEEQPIPSLLQGVLRTRSDLRVLDPAADLQGGYTVDELRDLGHWPPWVVADIDHDGRPDVVATVVTRGNLHKQFGVLVVHARTPGRVTWVVPLAKDALNGVAVDDPAEGTTITPLYCVECDANAWYRWNGHAYEPDLYAVGETVSVVTYDQAQTLGLFSGPSRKARFLGQVEPCTTARVVDRRGSLKTRWYLIEIEGSHRRGWVPAAFLAPSECIG